MDFHKGLLCCVLWVLVTVQPTALISQAETPGILQGVVVRSSTNESLSRVAITVAPKATEEQTAVFHNRTGGREIAILRLAHDGKSVLQPELRREPVLTDKDGRFVIEGLPAGAYAVMATREGYFGRGTDPETPDIYDGAALSDMTIVTIASGHPTSVAMELTPGAAISGRVTTPEGAAVVSQDVRAFRAHRKGDATILSGVKATLTDDRGQYRLHTLPPGEYFIASRLGVPDMEPGAPPVEPLVPGQQRTALTFHPSTTNPELSPPIVLQGGEDIDAKDIVMRYAPVIRISGEVLDESGIPEVSSAYVNLWPGSRAWRVVFGGVAGSEPVLAGSSTAQTAPGRRSFGIVGVFPPGLYELHAGIEFYGRRGQPARSASGRQEIEIGNEDIRGVTIAVKPSR